MVEKFIVRIAASVRRWTDDLLGVIYPHTCEICGEALLEGEKVICLNCLAKIPRKNFHGQFDSSIAMKFAGMAGVRRIASFFVYNRQGGTAAIIKKAKYANQPQIAYELARIFASELQTGDFFDGIDGIIPIPMHWFKQALRGYNQCEEIARGISDVTGLPVLDNLITVRPHKTQTRKSADERKSLDSSIFKVIAPEELAGKHVLVVDDVITTGSTISAACNAIIQAQPLATVSILSLAKAH